MKVACTHFQYAAWVFQALRERYGALTDAPDMTGDLFHLYSLIMLVCCLKPFIFVFIGLLTPGFHLVLKIYSGIS